MKVSLRSFLLLLTVAVSFLPVNASAQGLNLPMDLHPSICGAITSEQASNFIWNEEGLRNIDPNMAWWVNCPIALPQTYIGLVGSSPSRFELLAVNESDQPVEFACILRYWLYEPLSGDISLDNANQKAISESVIIEPGKEVILRWDLQASDDFTSRHLIQCELPTNVVIIVIRAWVNPFF